MEAESCGFHAAELDMFIVQWSSNIIIIVIIIVIIIIPIITITISNDDSSSWMSKVPYDFGDLGEKAKGGHVVNTNHRRVVECFIKSFLFLLIFVREQKHRRVVETWMDSRHKEYFYTRVPLARLSRLTPSPLF